MDCSLPGFSVHGIFQARVPEWVAFSFSRGSSWPRDQTQVFCIEGRSFTLWATREAQKCRTNYYLFPSLYFLFFCLHHFSFYSERGRRWSAAFRHLLLVTLLAEDFWSLPFHSAFWDWVKGRKTICSKTDNHDLCTWVAGIKVFNELTNICCRGEKPLCKYYLNI